MKIGIKVTTRIVLNNKSFNLKMLHQHLTLNYLRAVVHAKINTYFKRIKFQNNFQLDPVPGPD